MSERHNNALIAQMGASNARALSNALKDAMTECEDQGVSAYKDPACRLIAHQMAHLFGVASIMDTSDYIACVEICKKWADGNIVSTWDRR